MKLELDHFTMAYEDTGVGHPILFIHGYPLGRRIWDPQLRNLLGMARLVVPDLRGHGDSEPTDVPYSMELFADDCMTLCERREVKDPLIVCGLSMGGYVSLQLVQKYKEHVAGLVLVATRAGADSDEGKKARDADIALLDSKGASTIVDKMLPRLLTPETLRRRPKVVELAERTMRKTSAQTMAHDLAAMKARPDMREMLATIDVPTLIVHGKEDTLIPPKEAEAMGAAIPNATLVLIDGAAHLVNIEQPTAFNEALKKFYQRVWSN